MEKWEERRPIRIQLLLTLTLSTLSKKLLEIIWNNPVILAYSIELFQMLLLAKQQCWTVSLSTTLEISMLQ